MIAREYKKLFIWGSALLGSSAVLVGLALVPALAQSQENGFSLLVSPSPLVATVKPGQTTELELKIQNSNTETEELKIEARKFSVNKQTGEIVISDTEAPEVAPWIKFSQPIFKVKSGDWATEKVRVSLPKESGFSYSLALVVSRTKDPKAKDGERAIKGSVAVFTLINVDRPGATRKMEVTEFAPSQPLYEYLPAELNVTFKNTGNTIIQPAGNIFIQRGSNDTTPIATLPANDKKGYLLPDTPRTLKAEWNTGFPSYKTTVGANGEEKKDLVWDWSKLADFRIGPYTAKLVAIYNDGQRDVPIMREVTFWVIPWRAILILLAVVLGGGYLQYKMSQRKTRKAVKRALEERDKTQTKTE